MSTKFKSLFGELAQQPEPSWDEVTEKTYRRGFSHGVNEITEAVAPCLSAETKNCYWNTSAVFASGVAEEVRDSSFGPSASDT